MKLNRIIRISLAALAFASTLALAAPAQKSNAGLLRQEVKQNNIGVSLQRVARQLDAVIAEYNRNGLEGDDVDTLRRFRGMLNQLTGAEVSRRAGQGRPFRRGCGLRGRGLRDPPRGRVPRCGRG